MLWVAMLKSGVHATLAGILLAFTIPMRPKYDPQRFLSQIDIMVEQIRQAYRREKNIVKNDELRSQVRALGEGVEMVQAPAQILERKMHLPSAYLVIPIFSLTNAGVPVDWSSLGDIVTHPVSMGIAAGLVIGKLIGIAGFSWAAVKLGITALPQGLNFKHIIGVALMGGIGFPHYSLVWGAMASTFVTGLAAATTLILFVVPVLWDLLMARQEHKLKVRGA